MSPPVAVIGAGIGGLSAAIRLAQLGYPVQVFEARSGAGGLASGVEWEGFPFDAGPYILLDREGLEWAFARLGMSLDGELELRPIDEVYEVRGENEAVRFYADRERTADELDRAWPGTARRYLEFVGRVEAVYERTRPLLRTSRPLAQLLLSPAAWRDIPFLLQSLGKVLAESRLPPVVQQAIAIWTHVAGQRPSQAGSPMALIPALIHTRGAFLPRGGVTAVGNALEARARRLGVEFFFRSKVTRIRFEGGRVRGLASEGQGDVPAAAVVSNANGIGTYLDLAGELPPRAESYLSGLPLQSPGVCAYLKVRGEPRSPYLRFRIGPGTEGCRLLVQPGVVDPSLERAGWWPARLLAPLDYEKAERLGPSGQREWLKGLVAEPWWKEFIEDYRVLALRVPSDWGAEYHLYRSSMNPVMTARFMRAGRLAHRSPYRRGLYLAGSSTHPGQWVSFCAISGVLAAEALHRDRP
jgi:phytoene dehydrogenase-like protein